MNKVTLKHRTNLTNRFHWFLENRGLDIFVVHQQNSPIQMFKIFRPQISLYCKSSTSSVRNSIFIQTIKMNKRLTPISCFWITRVVGRVSIGVIGCPECQIVTQKLHDQSTVFIIILWKAIQFCNSTIKSLFCQPACTLW